MNFDATCWAAIGSCATAVIAFFAWRCQKRALETQKQALALQERSHSLQEKELELQGRCHSLQEKEFSIQEKLYSGELLLSLEYRGDYIAAVLQNTGSTELYDVQIKTTPALEVPAKNPKSRLDVSRTWVVPYVKIQRFLPHQVLIDEKAFLSDEFVTHFQGDNVIVVEMTYKRNGETITSKQTIDIGTISRINHETAMRNLNRTAKDEISTANNI